MPLLGLLPYMTSGTEAVRLRNALLLMPPLASADEAAAWAPPAWPAGFKTETVPPDPVFVALAARLQLAQQPDDWARARLISAHLLGSQPVLNGGAVQLGLAPTYRRIVEQGDGYCADFVRSFTAIANAAGMLVRQWSFSFDGFGGHGHIWVEVWNRQRQRWQLLDVFDNYYFTDGGEEPLSALAFRQALAAGSPTLALRLIHPPARPGYEIEAKAWDYFRRGLPEWYLWYGNNVFSVDAAPVVRVFEGRSRSVAQLAAIATGVHPGLRILPDRANEAQRQAIAGLQRQLKLSAAIMALGLVLWLAWAAQWLMRRRRAGGVV
ncbi:MAG: transglutaminase domain-containing protein [Burkholderiales bacterium]|nr:transglutaminase domain-containing protein [Burkholderiales bacterium]